MTVNHFFLNDMNTYYIDPFAIRWQLS